MRRPYRIPWPDRFLLAFTILLLAACGRRANSVSSYDSCFKLYIRGTFPECLACIAKEGPSAGDARAAAEFRLLEAEARLGANQKAEAKKILEGSVPPELEARRVIDFAELAFKNREYDAVERLLDTPAVQQAPTAMRIRADIVRGYARILGHRASDGVPLLRQAAQEAKKTGDGYRESLAFLDLSVWAHGEGRYDEERLFAEAAIQSATPLDARRVLAYSHNNLANALTWLGDTDRALEHFRTSSQLMRQIGDGAAAFPVGNSGLAYSLQGSPEQAVNAYREAFGMSQQGGDRAGSALWSANLAQAEIDRENWSEAERWLKTSREITAKDDDRRLLRLAIIEATLANARQKYRDAEKMIRAALDSGSEDPGFRWEAHAVLARSYFGSKQYAAANREFESALASVEQARKVLDNDYQMRLVGRVIGLYQSYVEALVQQGQDEKAWQMAGSSRARVLSERLGRRKISSSLDVSSIRKVLAARQAVLLTYWIGPQHSYAWLLNDKGLKRFDLPKAAEIAPLAAGYRRYLEGDPAATESEAGSKLWEAVVAPLVSGIPPGTKVIVVPDGPLHRLNLEALRKPDGRYWLEDVRLAVAPSWTFLSASREETGGDRLLLIGDPEQASPDFPRLSQAGREIKAISSSFGGRATVRLGPEAKPGAYAKSNPQEFQLIHFASHADANARDPLDSAVILSPDVNGYKLYARNVIDIPIRARLVSLSSCRSAGVRSYEGEGLIGFAWAFLGAGAEKVIAGLWDVNDEQTAAMMSNLYDNLSRGADPIDALHEAKLRIKSASAKPYYWAPFQIYVRSL